MGSTQTVGLRALAPPRLTSALSTLVLSYQSKEPGRFCLVQVLLDLLSPDVVGVSALLLLSWLWVSKRGAAPNTGPGTPPLRKPCGMCVTDRRTWNLHLQFMSSWEEPVGAQEHLTGSAGIDASS